jgi:predicted RNA binding protein YcfA (HicA-like mRNA interferase family)
MFPMFLASLDRPRLRRVGWREMNRRRLLLRLARGDPRNVRFADFRGVVEAFGFHVVRVSGSHHVFAHAGITELVNLQEVAGEAKPYQIRQLLRIVERHALHMEDD